MECFDWYLHVRKLIGASGRVTQSGYGLNRSAESDDDRRFVARWISLSDFLRLDAPGENRISA
jgi:hypothetical protein